MTEYVLDAIYREKQIKGWKCKKKLELIKSSNPTWTNFAGEWYSDDDLGI